MPKYTNATAVDITVGSIRFPAFSDTVVDNFIEASELPTGLTLASVLPQIQDSILLDNKYTALTGADVAAISVPQSPTKGYKIFFYVDSGEFTIVFNDPTAIPAIRVLEGATWERTYVDRIVNDIRIHCVTGGTIQVRISKG